MSARSPRKGPHRQAAARNAGPRLRRLAAALIALTCALLASAAIVPAASARMLPDGGPPYWEDLPGAQPPVPAVTGGMPGWQITLIVTGAAVLAALLAVAADRARSARRHVTPPSPDAIRS